MRKHQCQWKRVTEFVDWVELTKSFVVVAYRVGPHVLLHAGHGPPDSDAQLYFQLPALPKATPEEMLAEEAEDYAYGFQERNPACDPKIVDELRDAYLAGRKARKRPPRATEAGPNPRKPQ